MSLNTYQAQNEAELEQQMKAFAIYDGCWLLRNNSGALPRPLDKNGKKVDGRPIRFGLGNDSSDWNKKFKSSDEIGITVVTITPEMVGKKLGVFTAIEVKEPGWKYTGKDREPAQLNFIEWVKARGGFAGFVSTPTGYKEIIGK